MRRVGAVCLLAAVLVPGAARATPTIDSLKVSASPIPGFPGTGDKPGAGALIKGYAKISGDEYGGAPEPLVGLTVETPAGMSLHRQGFASCAASVLMEKGPQGCPKGSSVGLGSALGVVTFGGERVPEHATVQPFFAPEGGFEVYVFGASPALLEVLAKAHIAPPAPGFGHTLVGEIPLIETVPGGYDASFLEGTIAVGAAYRHNGRTISYITLPPSCPKGGWPVKAELRFMGGGEIVASTKMACPNG